MEIILEQDKKSQIEMFGSANYLRGFKTFVTAIRRGEPYIITSVEYPKDKAQNSMFLTRETVRDPKYKYGHVQFKNNAFIIHINDDGKRISQEFNI